MKGKNFIVVVIDAFGIDTLEHLLGNYKEKVSMPNLARLGLGNLLKKNRGRLPVRQTGLPLSRNAQYFKSVKQVSASADSLVGHREMMGIVDRRTYNLFCEGFPEEYLNELEKRTGRKSFFNKMAGGIEAIKLNAERHERTGELIIYASKCDPLIQIAMNENVIPVGEQHRIADTAFALAMEMGIPITRAIARSYVTSEKGEIIRTSNRYDAVLPIGGKTLIEVLTEEGVWTCAVGKTSDLVNAKYHEKIKLNNPVFLDPSLNLKFVHPSKKDTNPYSLQGTINALKEANCLYRPQGTFIFSNLVDTDSLYGHTKDIEGAIKCVEEIDSKIPILEDFMSDGDVLLITADHGMEHRDDYGYHSNENLPILVKAKGSGFDFPDKYEGLLKVGGCVAEFFGVAQKYTEVIERGVQG